MKIDELEEICLKNKPIPGSAINTMEVVILLQEIPKLIKAVKAAKLSVINIQNGINKGVYRHRQDDTIIPFENWHKLNKAVEDLERE